MLRRTSLLLGLVMLAAAFALSATPAVALTAPYFATNLPESGILGQMVNQPQAVRAVDVTYIAYQGPGLDPYVASYNWSTLKWSGPYRAGTNAQVSDAHGAPAIFIDSAGYIHLYFGPHRAALSHTMSAGPGRIDAWVAKPKIPGDITYPQIVRTADGAMLFYRGASDLWWSLESADGTTWTNPRQLTGASYPQSFYCSFREGPDHSVLMAAVRMNWNEFFAESSYGRHDVFFSQLKAADKATYTWRNSAEDSVTVPIMHHVVDKDLSSAEVTESVVATTGLNTTNIPVPGYTAAGQPGVLWNEGGAKTGGVASRTFKFAYYDGDQWQKHNLASTDHIYDAGTWRAEKSSESTRNVAYLEINGTSGTGTGAVWDYTDIGGNIVRFTSGDGTAWDAGARIDPGTDGALLGRGGIYHNPHLVTHDQADQGTQDTVMFQEQCPDASIEAYAGYLYGPGTVGTSTKFPGLTGRTYTPAVTRIAAADRYSEAAAIGKKAFPQGTGNVVIASGETFADALVAAPLAKALDAPILLVRHNAVPADTLSAISYLGADKAYVIGGKTTIEDGVVSKLYSTHISKVERIAASNRYDTAALVAQKLFTLKGMPDVAYIANGEKFADGLSIGSVAASQSEPVLLVRPGSVPLSVTTALAKLSPGEVVIVGGPASVAPAVATQLKADGRLDGLNRYEVADKVAAYGVSRGLSVRRAVVVTGRDFPDCLTAAVLAARLKGIVLLTPTPALSAGATAHLRQYRDQRLDVYVCGGTASVSTATFDQIKAAVAP